MQFNKKLGVFVWSSWVFPQMTLVNALKSVNYGNVQKWNGYQRYSYVYQ